MGGRFRVALGRGRFVGGVSCIDRGVGVGSPWVCEDGVVVHCGGNIGVVGAVGPAVVAVVGGGDLRPCGGGHLVVVRGNARVCRGEGLCCWWIRWEHWVATFRHRRCCRLGG